MQPVVASSALPHGVTAETIVHAVNKPILSEDLDEGMTVLIGPDRAGDLYEIGVASSDQGR